MSHTTTIFFVVYRIVNNTNGKSYVGLTRNLNKRLRTHTYKTSRCSAIREAITKYGVKAFGLETLAADLSLKEAQEFERMFIKQYNTMPPNGYNLTDGGEHFTKVSEETRKKLSLGRLGKTSPRKGVKLSEETKRKISKAKLGISTATEESRERWSKQRIGNTRAIACAIVQISKSGRQLRQFRSIKQASETTKIDRTGINAVCLGKRKRAGGYQWKYV